MKRSVPKWMEKCVFYEIYPQSFYDTNGDGIGDLNGITAKLDYVKDLGCDALWINPCFVSPFQDAGYDISDYYKIAPRYGTNSDMKRLFAEAKKRGMRIILDLVPGHTSLQHPWFKESCKPEKNKYTDRFIWTRHCFDSGSPYRSISGYSDRDAQFLINFFYCQPALNYGFAKPDPEKTWQQPFNAPGPRATREELKKIMRFWLDMGADGFRVDMAFSLIKGDSTGKYTRKIWGEVREMLDRDYPEAIIISEWGQPHKAVEAGFHCDFMLHFGPQAYNSLFRFEVDPANNTSGKTESFFRKKGKGSVKDFVEYYQEITSKISGTGYVCIPSGNHDMVRLGLNRTAEELKVVFAFLLTMPGTPFIYYGDEIGMKHRENLRSKEGGFLRTGARTPMQWDNSKNMGFSKASPKKLYLPVDKKGPTVAEELTKENSLRKKVQELIKLRKSTPALAGNGTFTPLFSKANKYPFVYMRSSGSERYIVVVNPSGKKVSASVKVKNTCLCLKNGAGITVKTKARNVTFTCNPVSYGIYKVF